MDDYARFYTACLRVYKIVSHYVGLESLSRKDVTQAASGKEGLERLYIWGEGFSDGNLNRALEESDEIRDNVLELLLGIGETLVRGKSQNMIFVVLFQIFI